VRLSRVVEAVLFASQDPLSPAEIARASEELDEERVDDAVAELRAEYDREERSFQIA
jgi:chromosome segregation and condensation protein ScpB